MAPRHQTLPPAQTSSAREALQSFYCQLCAKGYSRMNEYEAHLSSYDHSHKQRLKDMKAMVRDPNAGARARKAEARADGLVSIKLAATESMSGGAGGSAGPASGGGSGSGSGSGSGGIGGGGGGGGFKKGGFKKSGFRSAFNPVTVTTTTTTTATNSSTPTGLSNPLQATPSSRGTAGGSPEAEQRDGGDRAGHNRGVDSDSDSEDEMYDRYDPRYPTD